MSSAPDHDAPAGLLPTAIVPVPSHPTSLLSSSKFAVPLAHVGSGPSPHGYFRCTGPFAAYSHSASDGNRIPRHSQ